MIKKIVFLGLWVSAMLFPVKLITAENVAGIPVASQLMESEFAHVVGHLLLFAGLTICLSLVFHLPFNLRTGFLLAAAVVLVGLGQEYLQLQVKGRAFGAPEVFDLQVDLVGGYFGWRISYFLRWFARHLRFA
jgi:glycopeptide antibiotics resistance protein